jgi:hypothetical protein
MYQGRSRDTKACDALVGITKRDGGGAAPKPQHSLWPACRGSEHTLSSAGTRSVSHLGIMVVLDHYFLVECSYSSSKETMI